jgi:hypothetical protein
VPLKVGKADTSPDAPAHTPGVKQGNSHPVEKNKGHTKDGRSNAKRSTGVNSRHHEPIDPRMPNLSPP